MAAEELAPYLDVEKREDAVGLLQFCLFCIPLSSGL